MALPKLDTPTFKLKVPSTGKTVSYRPFLVKEEKILLMARESKKTNDIQITKTEMDSKIQLTSTVGVILRHPTVEIVSGLNTEDPMEVLMGCMESIFDDTTVHNLQEYSKKEIKDFVDALSIKEVQKIQDYFEAMPKLTCDVKFTCPACGHENTVRVEGLSNFF